jgi:hypothetical protein
MDTRQEEAKPKLVFNNFSAPRVLSGNGPHGEWEIVQVLLGPTT